MNRTTASDQSQRRSKSRPILAFSLAALAVVGIGAAATSASWTDNVLFSASAQAATFDIQGSLDNSTWKQSNNASAIDLVVPSSTFANLVPGETRTATLYVKNFGSTQTSISASVVPTASNTFTGLNVSLSGTPGTLAANGTTGDTATITLTVAAPANWAQSNVGKTGGYVVTVGSQLGTD